MVTYQNTIVDASGNATTARSDLPLQRSEVWAIIGSVLPWSNTSPSLGEVEHACIQLKKRREVEKNWYNMALAAAEHHLVARHLAFKTGDPFVRSGVVGYATLKAIFKHYGLLQVLRYEKSYPCLPPTMDNIGWGFFGTTIGLMDWAREHPNQAAQWGGVLEYYSELGAELVYGKAK